MISQFLLLTLPFLLGKPLPAYAVNVIPDELQTTLVKLYSADRCDGVNALTQNIDLTQLRPNVMAIAAYCEPPEKDANALFELAESLSPTGDLILVLYGKWAWKHDRKKSKEIWSKVLMLARIEYFRSLAKEYLAKVVTKKSNAKPMDLSSSTEFLRFSLSGIHKQHPQPFEFNYLKTNPANGLKLNAFFSKRKWISAGSLALRYETTYDQFSQASSFNQWLNNLEVLFAIHVANSKDIIIRPFVEYRSLGGNPFSINYGLGVTGAVYKSNYVQSVQALMYSSNLFTGPISSTEGAHYRFEYAWDFYPKFWLITTQFSIDHLSSEPTTQFLGANGSFEHSNNQFTFNLKFEHELHFCTLSLEPSIAYRVFTDDSKFIQSQTQSLQIVKEEDWESHLKLTASIPFVPSFNLFAWYEWTHNISNLDQNAYINRNFNDHTVGLGVRTYLSTY